MPLLTTRAGASSRAFGFGASSSEPMTLLATFQPSTTTTSYTLEVDPNTYKSFFIAGYAEHWYTGGGSDGVYASSYIMFRNASNVLMAGYSMDIMTGRYTNSINPSANSHIAVAIPQYNHVYNRPASFRALVTNANSSNTKPYSYEALDYAAGFGYFTRNSSTGLINSSDKIAKIIISETTRGFYPATKILIYGIKGQ